MHISDNPKKYLDLHYFVMAPFMGFMKGNL